MEFGFISNLKTLQLSGKSLSGDLIPFSNHSIFQLQNLYIQCGSCYHSRFPKIATNFSALKELHHLPGSQITGEIPSTFETYFPKLEVLNLSNNSFEGNFTSVLRLTALRVVNLAHNQFSGSIPSDFHELNALQELDLSNNRLHGTLPKEVSHCKQLKVLSLGSNKLTGTLPTSLANLSYLNY